MSDPTTLSEERVLAKEGFQMAGTIVCGVSESPEARAAARLAGVLAHRLALRLVLVHVVEVPEAHGSSSLGSAEQTLDAIETQLAERIPVETRVMFGDRAALLAQAAAEEGADLIVLGSRADGFRNRHLRCTLARELEAATPIPVLLASVGADERSERRLERAVRSAGGADTRPRPLARG